MIFRTQARRQDRQLVAGQALKVPVLLAYGGLALPLALAEIPIIVYLPAFYTKELALDTALVGFVFLAARFWDGLFDLLVGHLSDRTNTRIGARKPWVIAATPVLVIGIWFLCNPSPGAGLAHLGIWTAVFYTAFTFMKIPYWSWGVELENDYTQRNRVVSYREGFTFVGNLIFVSAPVFLLPSNASLHAALEFISLLIIFLVPLMVLPLITLVPDRKSAPQNSNSFLKSFKAILRNRAAVLFFSGTIIYFVANGVINAVAVFLFDTGLGFTGKLFQIIFIYYIVMIAIAPIVLRLARRFEKHHLLALGCFLFGISIFGLLFIPSGAFILFIALWIVAAIGNAFVMILPLSLVADIVDVGEVEASVQQPGAYVAVYNLVAKIGSALGVGLAFWLLDWVAFEPAASTHTSGDSLNVRLIGFLLPSLLMIPTTALFLQHPITRREQAKLRQTLDQRRSVS